MYYYRNRYYSTVLQRFVSEDPIGFAGGDINLYAYVGNDPINRVDPLGLDWIDDGLYYGSQVSAGFGDTITFGLTSYVRSFTAGAGVVETDSYSYMAGQAGGIVWSTAMGGAVGAARGNAIRPTMGMSRPNPAFPRGIEWVERSHWIPKKWLPDSMKWSKWNLKRMWGSDHALSDPARYQFLRRPWKQRNPLPNPLSRHWNRLPDWAKGSLAGALFGGTGSQVGKSLAGRKD